ncbi:MAG: AAA family ATPase [Candidatus Omnitrophota bacterium]|jgi:DNA repair exonuclease SbcCD ATPase subunit
MKLNKIKIQGFRGFNAVQEINLDAGLIIIYGLNGTGKSSLTEALEWLFFGDISRRKLSPCKSEYQYEEYLKNLFYRGQENPYVEVSGKLDGQDIRIKKELVSEKEVKYFINDSEVSDLSSLSLNLESYSRPMLAQTEIAALVNTEQKDRWEQISYILGLEDLTKLRQHLIELRNAKKDFKYKEVEKEFEGILVDLRKTDGLAEVLSMLESLDTAGVVSSIQSLIKQEGIDASQENYGNAIKIKLGRLLGSDLAKRAVELKLGTSADFDVWGKGIKEKWGELEKCILSIASEHVDFDRIDFLTKGKKIAVVPVCPFCNQKSLTTERISEITTELAAAKKATTEKTKCEDLVSKIKNELSISKIREAISAVLPSSQELKIIAQKLADFDLKDLAGKVQALEKDIDKYLSDSASILAKEATTHLCTLENYYFHNNKATSPEDTKQSLNENIETISSSLNAYISQWIALRDQIVKPFSSPSASAQKEVEKWILIDKVNNFILREIIFLKKRKLIKQTEEIQAKLESFEKKQVENLLVEHSEEIKNYYNQLNPNEKILFKKIEVKDGIRRQARLIAEAYGKEINPVTIFSEAHTNSLSLSIYFPQRVDRNPTWGVMVLDDPVQSMDQGHSFTLIEILALLKAKKQIIVLTHSKSFAEDFVNRFSPDEILHYEFIDGGEEGPTIKLRQGKTLDYIAFVEKNHNGNQIERQSAGNALRNAIASVCGEILLKKGRTLTQVRGFDEQGLGKLFDQVERADIPTDNVNKLRVLVNQGHADSHAWNVRDTNPDGLLQGIKNVKEVFDKHVKDQSI